MSLSIWLRAESRGTERRTPLTPGGARQLLDAGADVSVECSPRRIFADSEYRQAGCEMVAAGGWITAPGEAVILGLKELPETPATLEHSHIYFAHAYKEQAGWRKLLGRFDAGGGRLLDIEYLADDHGRRVAAFGYWAGYMGAALALMQWLHKQIDAQATLETPLVPYADEAALDAAVAALADRVATAAPARVLVMGALGRSGRGAITLLERHGAHVTRWDKDETRQLDRPALLAHDLFVNCALIIEPVAPFVTRADLADDARRLSVISDVSCDPASPVNPLPFYTEPTSWEHPVLALVRAPHPACDLIAIDNLPSLLPRESSEDFAAQLLPHLLELAHGGGVWARSEASFREHVGRL